MSRLLMMRTRGLYGPFFDRNCGNRAAHPLAHTQGNFISKDGLGLGPELILNGGFDTDTVWGKGTGWSIAAGVGHCDGTQVGPSLMSQACSPLLGRTYQIIFTVSNYVAGNVRSRLGSGGGSADGLNRAANGTFSDLVTYPGGTSVHMRADLNFVGDVDNVSMKLLLD